jgi:hypothetical protein
LSVYVVCSRPPISVVNIAAALSAFALRSLNTSVVSAVGRMASICATISWM